MIKIKIIELNEEYHVFLCLDGESQLILETKSVKTARSKALALKREIPFLKVVIDVKSLVDLAGLSDDTLIYEYD